MIDNKLKNLTDNKHPVHTNANYSYIKKKLTIE
jgi:hypothetical protein